MSRKPRVCSVPHDHPYVERVLDAQRVEVFGDPTNRGDGRCILDPSWFAARGGEFDLVHLHFGYERLSTDTMRRWLRSVTEHDVPLVATVHDLRNPHLLDNRHHRDLQDLLLPAADELITLTSAAADEVRRRWGRKSMVLPHPHVAEESWLRAEREAPGDRPRVGLHLKSLRTNFAAEEVLAALRALLRTTEVLLDIRLHNDVDGGRLRRQVADVVDIAPDRVAVTVSDYLSDHALCRWIAGLDVVLLPYRFGTHSGWVELCKDLGTRVVTPRLPTYLEQGATASFPVPDEQPTATGMHDAVRRALSRPAPSHTAQERLTQAARVRSVHTKLYRKLAGRSSALVSAA